MADVRAATGFDYDQPPTVPLTPGLSNDETLLLRSTVAQEVAATYPAFARKIWNVTVK